MRRHYPDFPSFLTAKDDWLGKGPVALMLAEDDVELDTSLRHNLQCGFETVIALMPPDFILAADLDHMIWRVDYDVTQPDALMLAVNKLIEAAPGTWIYCCYNAEYLFFPFCETRSVGEMLTFHTEERREAMLCYTIDLYTKDFEQHPNAVSLDGAYLDRTGYYALERSRPGTDGPMERQLDFYGGLRWRFEEHVPADKRKIDRIALFKAKPGLEMRPDHTFTDEEYNTYACPWHNNLTAAICSFRTAKALKANPGSTYDIHSFHWYNSEPFEWHSRQLLDLGLMEPGQWF